MKTGMIACLSIAIAWALLAIVQLWSQVIPEEIFLKLSITAGVFVAMILIVSLAIREYISDREMKSKGFIDD